MISPLAGKPAPESILANIPRLVTGYYVLEPDPAVPEQRVAFGTSGHRGTSLQCAFNEEHVVAITQAICIYRQQQGIDGPIFIGLDTHALSEPAFASTLEVLAANGVEAMIDDLYGCVHRRSGKRHRLRRNSWRQAHTRRRSTRRRRREVLGRHRRALQNSAYRGE